MKDPFGEQKRIVDYILIGMCLTLYVAVNAWLWTYAFSPIG